MMAEVLVRFTIEHTAPDVAASGLVQGACEVGTEEAPVHDFKATDIGFDVLNTSDDVTWAYALELVGEFGASDRDDFYGRLANSARSIAESIQETRRTEDDE